jgi:hypothetical protein
MATYTPATSNFKVRGWNEQWHSAYSFEFPQQVWQTWYKRYGRGFGMFDFLTIMGNTVNLKGDTIRAFEDAADVRPIRVDASGIARTSAGGDIAFKLHAEEYETTTNKTYLRVGETIVIPALYADGSDVPIEYKVTVVGAASGADCTAKALGVGNNLIATGVPANSYLMVGATRYARGVGQPSGRSSGGYYRDFVTGISKESFLVEGGQIAQESYRSLTKGGESGVWSRALMQNEFSLNNQIDKAIFLSQENTNSLVESTTETINNATRSTKGFWNWADELAQELNWSIKFSIGDLETAQELQRSQGVIDTDAVFVMGPKLARQIENMGLEFVKDYSNTDLKKLDEIGFSMKSFLKLGINFHMRELVSFSNPNTYGVDADYFGNAGLIFPMSEVTVKSDDFIGGDGGKIVLPNLAIGYLNNATEDRTRIIKFVAGMNGIGLPAVDEYDRVRGFMLTEYSVIANLVNQWIRVLKTGTY